MRAGAHADRIAGGVHAQKRTGSKRE